MSSKSICVCIFTLMISNVVWSDEVVRPRKAVKQRVSPKVLREAMALPEYRAKAPESPPAPTLDDLQALADRLKKSGDNEGADLLHRFIVEHRQIAKQVTFHPTVDGNSVDIHVKIFDLNLDDLPEQAVLRLDNLNDKSDELQVELANLVAAENGTIQTMVVSTNMNHPVKGSIGGEFPVPFPSENGTVTIQFRDFGTSIEVLPTSISAEEVRLQMSCEISEKDEKNSVTISGTTVPGIKTKRVESTFDIKFGAVKILSGPMNNAGHRLFLMTHVTHRK